MSVILSAQNLEKKYGNLIVLDKVSLAIEQGEFISITGPSGAGKSTLLHLLGALDKPNAGTVNILDKNIFTLPNNQQSLFRNQHLGFVFQFHHLLPEFTAIENVAMPLWIAKKDKNEALSQAQNALERVGLNNRLHHKPTELSGGEQQRVAIARAIVHKPSIVFADEPSGNLDTANAQSIHQLFWEISKELKQTVIVVTHNQQLADMADRTLSMKDGRIIA